MAFQASLTTRVELHFKLNKTELETAGKNQHFLSQKKTSPQAFPARKSVYSLHFKLSVDKQNPSAPSVTKRFKSEKILFSLLQQQKQRKTKEREIV